MKFNKVLYTLDRYDKYVSKYIHSTELNKNIEIIVYCLARMFNPDIVVCYFILMSIFSYNNLHFVLKPILHTLLSLLVSLIIKKLIARPRPQKFDTNRLYDLRQHEKNFSMPSGDSLQAANFAIILFVYYNTFIGFLFIPLVMYARIFYFCHYILDTVAGCTLGILVSYITYLVIN